MGLAWEVGTSLKFMPWGTEPQGGPWSKEAESCRLTKATVPKKTMAPEDTETQGVGQDLEEQKAANLRQKDMIES